MKIGLLGLPNSGKTTIFNALTRSQAEVTAYASQKIEPNLAVVEVGDERVIRLAEMYQPKKTIHATIEVMDFVGMAKGAANSGSFSGELLKNVKTVDAIALVIRNFEDDLVGAPTPMDDLDLLETELILTDLVVVENRLERIANDYKRGKKTNILEQEKATLERIAERLNDNHTIQDLEFSADEEKLLRGFQFLTKKQIMVILNSSEDSYHQNPETIQTISAKYPIIEFAGSFEMDLAQLEDEGEARMFMEDMGISESARDRLTRIAYEILGYISFFTVGSDEVRA